MTCRKSAGASLLAIAAAATFAAPAIAQSTPDMRECTRETLRFMNDANDLCGCETITREALTILQRADNFIDLLDYTEGACPGFAGVLADVPVAATPSDGESFAERMREEGDDDDDGTFNQPDPEPAPRSGDDNPPSPGGDNPPGPDGDNPTGPGDDNPPGPGDDNRPDLGDDPDLEDDGDDGDDGGGSGSGSGSVVG
jgi:hypothetical protein